MFAVCRSPFAVGVGTRPWTRLPFCRVNPLDKPRQHLFDIRCRTFQSFSLFWSEKSQILRQQNKTNQFVGRTRGYVQELTEFGAGRSSTSFRNIGRDGSRRSAHLAGQAKSFGIRISSRRTIDTQRQSLTPLPYLQFPEVLHVLTLSCFILERVTLAQEYYIKQVAPRLSGPQLTISRLDFPAGFALTANGERQTANQSGELPC